MAKPYIDVAIISPLREEFHRLQAAFKTISEAVDGTLFLVELESPIPGLTIAAVLQDDMGKSAATRAADALISKYDIGLMVVAGIAGGLSNDAGIGDVCFTGTVIDVLENIKVSAHDKGGQALEYNSHYYPTDPLLTFSLKYAQLGSDIRPQFEKWQQERFSQAKALIPGEFIGRESKNEAIGLPQIHDGSIVCGFVSKSEIYKSDLQKGERKVLALETESGGPFRSAQSAGIPAIAIRGICDYADKNKNKLEQQTSGKTRQIAADNAITFLKLQLANPQFRRYLARRQDEVLKVSSPLLDNPQAEGASALRKVRETIHQQLSLLSPHYQDKPEGYRLPLPRVRRSKATATVSPAKQKSEPINILEAISAHHVIVIDVPRSYPDYTLPWLLANELSLVELDAKQAVPVVISGDALRPPHGTIALASGIDVEKLIGDELRPVVIITDFPPSLRPRLDFLRSEFDKYPAARFVLINRIGPNVATDTNLVVTTGAEHLDLCSISFAEISSFFQRTFHMPDQEASVAALRLQGMFKRFKLNAHPSYFSGVASELLTALLRANRRTELLQIAVGGFLSFVVAGDRSEVVLSRTTREEFLRKLIFAQRVEKQSFDRAALVKFVEQFAADRDFDTEPLEFVRSFQERGIIHFDVDNVAISLPFIESYLLAVELSSRPADAVQYFSIGDEDFDFSTFDVYAEIGASDAVISAVVAALDQTIAALTPGGGVKHILLTDEIHPPIVVNQERLAVIQDRLQKAFDDVVYSRPNSAEKQRLLDIAARAEEGAKAAREKARSNNGNQDSELNRLNRPMYVWGAATLLIGSGSERLSKKPKRLLAAKIVTVTSLLLDWLMRSFSRVDFGKMKSTIESDNSARDIFDLGADQPIPDDYRAFLSAILDAYEFSLIGYPIRALFELLGNAAGQPVLARSISSLVPPDAMENLIARVWGAEINAKKEGSALQKAIADLPAVPFLRYTLYQFFLTRVFWNHWETPNRLALLEAANTAIQPFGRRLDPGKIKRKIARQNSDKE